MRARRAGRRGAAREKGGVWAGGNRRTHTVAVLR